MPLLSISRLFYLLTRHGFDSDLVSSSTGVDNVHHYHGVSARITRGGNVDGGMGSVRLRHRDPGSRSGDRDLMSACCCGVLFCFQLSLVLFPCIFIVIYFRGSRLW